MAEEIERIAPSSVSIISVGWQFKFLAASEQFDGFFINSRRVMINSRFFINLSEMNISLASFSVVPKSYGDDEGPEEGAFSG